LEEQIFYYFSKTCLDNSTAFLKDFNKKIFFLFIFGQLLDSLVLKKFQSTKYLKKICFKFFRKLHKIIEIFFSFELLKSVNYD